MPPFEATYRGKDIFKIRVPRTGMAFSGYYEWCEAARWAGYTREAFAQLTGQDQASIVAQFRVHHQMEAVLAKVQADKLERASKKRP